MIPDEADGWMLTCVLVARDGSETTLSVPSLSRTPPTRIRRPSDLGGAAVVDVYTLSALQGSPPRAVYDFECTVPLSTDELPAGDIPAAGPAPSD
ncbi:hypothetical protein ACF1AJ_06855 [Leifsonia sp. NPDC014704]|uniref:hypothetical protein n=1 Tax=Leifsonia sp. NPDC014704 TaxID=3364123 RepID=UPI0036F4867E